MTYVSTLRTLTPEFIEKARPGDVLAALREAGAKNNVNGRWYSHDDFLYGRDGITPSEIIYGGRRQILQHTRDWQPYPRQRLWYFYNVQLQKEGVRARISDQAIAAHTTVPGPGRHRFPPNAEFAPLETVNFATMTLRRGQPGDRGMILDRFYVRCHVAELDRQDGTFKLGGSGLVDGNPISRTLLSRDFCREPGRKDKQAIPSGRYEAVVSSAISMVQVMEIAAVNQQPLQSVPRFPPIYLGFDTEAVPWCDTNALRRAAEAQVFQWIEQGLPVDRSASNGLKITQNSVADRLKKLDHNLIEGWPTLVSILDQVDLDFIMGWTFDRFRVRYQGLDLAPAAFFTPEAILEAMPNIQQVYVRLYHEDPYRNFMGREFMSDDGSMMIDPRLVKISLTTGKECLIGKSGDFVYNLTSTEVGKESELAS